MPARFSRPNQQRMANQASDNIYQYAGNTATWRSWVSAVSGVADAGEGSTYYYRESTITAVFGRGIVGQFGEIQMAAGAEAAGDTTMTTREKMGRLDEIVWRGVTYRVESDPQPARFVGNWICQLKRGET